MENNKILVNELKAKLHEIMDTDDNIVKNVNDFIEMSKVLMIQSHNRKELRQNMNVITDIINREEVKTASIMSQA